MSRAWPKDTEDPIVGANQKGDDFWTTVVIRFGWLPVRRRPPIVATASGGSSEKKEKGLNSKLI